MIKFILVVLFSISGPNGSEMQGMRVKFDSVTECEQAKQFAVETLKEYKDVTVVSAECKREADKTA